jgi:hypothetical protein
MNLNAIPIPIALQAISMFMTKFTVYHAIRTESEKA